MKLWGAVALCELLQDFVLPAFGVVDALGGAVIERGDVLDRGVDHVLVDLRLDIDLEGTLVLVEALAIPDPATRIDRGLAPVDD